MYYSMVEQALIEIVDQNITAISIHNAFGGNERAKQSKWKEHMCTAVRPIGIGTCAREVNLSLNLTI